VRGALKHGGVSYVLAKLVHAAVPTRLLQSLRCCATSCTFSDKAGAQTVRGIVGAKMPLHDQAHALWRQARADYTSFTDCAKRCTADDPGSSKPILYGLDGTEIIATPRDADLLSGTRLIRFGAGQVNDQSFRHDLHVTCRAFSQCRSYIEANKL
jgi:hypothetical protein